MIIHCKYGPEVFKKLSFDEDYLISNYGRLLRVKSRWSSKVNKFLEYRVGGYKKQYLRFGIKDKDYYVHRLVLEEFFGPQPVGMQAAHLDGNPKNNHISNLAWVTPKENSSHKILHGTSGKGSKNAMAKISEFDVLQIRKMYSNGVHPKEIAKKFKIKNVTVIATGRAWKHISTPELVIKNKEIAKTRRI